MAAVCVFCGAKAGTNPRHHEAAQALGRALGRRKLTLVYGGAANGLMGLLADATLREGGRVIGVMPEGLVTEQAHKGLSELIITPDLATRKATMNDLADAFVALPGGFGTLDELFEVLTWSQLGLHRKPVGLLNSDGFWDGLLTFLGHGRDEGFLSSASLAAVRVDPDADVLLGQLLPAREAEIY